jgi:hypothetical protein
MSLRPQFIQVIKSRCLWLEAACYLVTAKIALRVLPFQYLEPFFERGVRGPQPQGEARRQITLRVHLAICSAAEHLPGEYVCFPRGIAAQAMLRRRKVATTLYYGASTQTGQNLTGHVWVMDGNIGVMGMYEVDQYHVLAQYPKAAAAIGTE